MLYSEILPLVVITTDFHLCLCFQLQTAEDVHLVVHPGTYAVTAGEWGTSQQQTHMVSVQPGQTINLDFVM